jgi:Transposase IS66 family
MDETPIKAGVASPGKMKVAYFWPIYGELDEICFKFYPDRSAKNVENALGLSPPDAAVLLTDGYSAYKKYAKKVGLNGYARKSARVRLRKPFVSVKQNRSSINSLPGCKSSSIRRDYCPVAR